MISPQGAKLSALAFDDSCLIVTHEGRLSADGLGELSFRETWSGFLISLALFSPSTSNISKFSEKDM